MHLPFAMQVAFAITTTMAAPIVMARTVCPNVASSRAAFSFSHNFHYNHNYISIVRHHLLRDSNNRIPHRSQYGNAYSSARFLSTAKSSGNINASKTQSADDLEKDRSISIVQDMLFRVSECNNVPEEIKHNLMDFVVDGVKVGKVTNKVATLLSNSTPPKSSSSPLLQSGENPPVFEIVESAIPSLVSSVSSLPSSSATSPQLLTLSNDAGKTVEERTDAVMSVMEHLRSKGIIKGWRNEMYPLSSGFYDEPVLFVERAAAAFLGIQQYGIHINGIVTSQGQGDDDHAEGERMWIARRSKTKSKYPGMLDHIVAGGQSAGLGLMENVLKECAEEAGIPEDIALDGITNAGVVSYEGYEPASADQDEYDGLISRALLFNYDLDLPPDFTPTVVDGEVEEFFLWTIPEIIESMKKDYADPIKPNCYLVIIDFLLRKGYISPETPGYLDLIRELRGGYCG